MELLYILRVNCEGQGIISSKNTYHIARGRIYCRLYNPQDVSCNLL